MNKYLISSLVITSFIGYSFYQRTFGVSAVRVLTPKNSALTTPEALMTSPTPTQSLPTDTPAASSNSSQLIAPTNTPVPPKSSSPYKDGAYTGAAADAFYGMIQVKATIVNGKITDITFLQAPNDRGTSIEINSQADPQLAQEAITAQSATVDIVSGATDSSQAFIQSLQSALNKAKS